MAVSKSSIERIIESISLEDHLKKYLTIKRSGQHAVAKCPFHADSSPSLYIYPNNYHCFACKAHGNVISFEMFQKNIGFKEAVLSLAEIYNISVDIQSEHRFLEGVDDKELFAFTKNLNLLCIKNYKKNGINKKDDLLENVLNAGLLDDSIELKSFVNLSNLPRKHKNVLDRVRELINSGKYFYTLPYKTIKGDISGFLFFSLNEESSFTHIIIEEHQSFFFIDDKYRCINLSDSRTFSAQSKNLYLAIKIEDFIYFQSLGLKNIIFFNAEKINKDSIFLFSRFSKFIYLIGKKSSFFNRFVWKSFEEIFYLSRRQLFVFSDFYFHEIKQEDIYEDIALKSKKIIEFVIDCLLDSKVIATRREFVFREYILKYIEKIEDVEKKKIIQEESYEYFLSRLKKDDDILKPTIQNDLISFEANTNKLKIKIELIDKVKNFYHNNLINSNNVVGLKYLENRGLGLDDIKYWKIGYCPGYHSLSKKVDKENISADLLLDLGILKNSKKSNDLFYDFFHERIIIPIADHNGHTVAFSGRIIGKNDQKDFAPKYINSPESDIFLKSEILYNFYHAKIFVEESDCVVIVEGFLDCISLYKSGIKNVMAVMGSVLTQQHILALSKITSKIILCFDNDDAGKKASKRSFLELIKYPNISVFSAELYDAKDPDEFLKKFGAGKFFEILEKSKKIHELVFLLIQQESRNKEDFLFLLRDFLKNSQLLENTVLFRDMSQYLETQYKISLKNIITMKEQEVQKTEQLYHADTKNDHQIKWTILSVLEIKFIFCFCFCKKEEFPEKLGFVFEKDQWNQKTDRDDKYLLINAFNRIFSDKTKNVLSELYNLIVNIHCDLLALNNENFESLSVFSKILISFLKNDVFQIKNLGFEYILKTQFRPQMITPTVFPIFLWHEQILSFLHFQKDKMNLFYQTNTHWIEFGKILIELELMEIDNQIKVLSTSLSNNSQAAEIESLFKEREKRRLILSSD